MLCREDIAVSVLAVLPSRGLFTGTTRHLCYQRVAASKGAGVHALPCCLTVTASA